MRSQVEGGLLGRELQRKPEGQGRLEGRVIIVTGAAQGIGRAIALKLASEGTNLVLADINEKGLQEVSNELARFRTEILAIPTDITSQRDQNHLLVATVAQFKIIDGLVNNAAMVNFREGVFVTHPSEEQTHAVWETNYHAGRKLSYTVAEFMRLSGNEGFITFITSVHARKVRKQPHYSGSKAATDMLMREMADFYGEFGIRINAVAPGAINTNKDATLDDLKTGHFGRRVPLGRMGTPMEVANIVADLATDDYSYVTGASIPVDGGLENFHWTRDLPQES